MDGTLHLFQGISPLIMCLMVLSEEIPILTDKDRQIIDIDLLLLIVLVVPDKAGVIRSSAIVLSPMISRYLYSVFMSKINTPPDPGNC